MSKTTKRKLNVGLCGAGLGGLAAAIAIARAGCNVTILEAAAELGEVNAKYSTRCRQGRSLIPTDWCRDPDDSECLATSNQMGRLRHHWR